MWKDLQEEMDGEGAENKENRKKILAKISKDPQWL